MRQVSWHAVRSVTPDAVQPINRLLADGPVLQSMLFLTAFALQGSTGIP